MKNALLKFPKDVLIYSTLSYGQLFYEGFESDTFSPNPSFTN